MGLASAIIGSAIIGGVATNVAANRARNATEDATEAQIRENQRAEGVARADLQPYSQGGQVGLNNITALAQGDNSNFFTAPGYEFVRDEGTRNIENTFSARGSGGNALRALAEFNSGLASQEYGNYWNRNFNLAAMGQNAAAGQATATQQSAGMSGNALANQGAAIGQIEGARYSGINNQLQAGLGNLLYAKSRGLI